MSFVKRILTTDPQGRVLIDQNFTAPGVTGSTLTRTYDQDTGLNTSIIMYRGNELTGQCYYKEITVIGASGQTGAGQILNLKRYNDGVNVAYEEVYNYDQDGNLLCKEIYRNGVLQIQDYDQCVTHEDGCTVTTTMGV